MSGKYYLLDTNIVIGLFANELRVVEKLNYRSSDILIPTIVLGELFYGAEQSIKRSENIQKIDSLAQFSTVIECDLNTARFMEK